MARVSDDAGGLPKDDLRYVVGPGQTGTTPTEETIGIFGVGTKRAVVALAQDITIKTRHRKETTHQVEFDEAWLADEDWELPVYEVDEIAPGTTIVELQKLRVQVTDEAIAQLRDHLETTYARFLVKSNITLMLNGEKLKPQFFENWAAYPPHFAPRKYTGTLKTEEGRQIRVEAIAGLTRESSPAAGEYGVYFYCNERLVARALKTFDVGFVKGLAGLPHPKVSLTRVLVFLNGDARSMPWNSSKSDISTKHEVFLALHNWPCKSSKTMLPSPASGWAIGRIRSSNTTREPSRKSKSMIFPPSPNPIFRPCPSPGRDTAKSSHKRTGVWQRRSLGPRDSMKE